MGIEWEHGRLVGGFGPICLAEVPWPNQNGRWPKPICLDGCTLVFTDCKPCSFCAYMLARRKGAASCGCDAILDTVGRYGVCVATVINIANKVYFSQGAKRTSQFAAGNCSPLLVVLLVLVVLVVLLLLLLLLLALLLLLLLLLLSLLGSLVLVSSLAVLLWERWLRSDRWLGGGPKCSVVTRE